MAGVPVRELTSSFALRYQNTQHTSHRGFSRGMIRDIPSWQLPEGACYDALDMLCDLPDKIRKRGGTTVSASGSQTAAVENLLSFKSGGYDAKAALLGSLGKGGSPKIVSFDLSTFVATTISSITASSGATVGRPFQHQNWGIFPFVANVAASSAWNALYLCGGSSSPLGSAVAPSSGTVIAGDNRVAVSGGAIAAYVGSVIWLQNGTTNYYFGRVVEVISSTSVRVEPTPTIGFTATTGILGDGAYKWSSYAPFSGVADVVSGRYGVSYQGRIVLGNTTRTLGTAQSDYIKGLGAQPNRVWWSQLQSEAIPAVITGTLDGDALLYPGAFLGTTAVPFYNYLDIPGIGGITGLAVAGEGNLIVFGPRKMFRISGELITETKANPDTTSFSVDQVSQNIGCIEAKSIQLTPGGLIFAGANDLYRYDGATLHPLLLGANARYYQSRLTAGDVILGSFFSPTRNHYYLSMSGADGGLMINLDTQATTRQSNLQVFDGVPDPVNSTKLWAPKWWDTTGAAPSFVGGQLAGVDQLWLPSSANASDQDGTVVSPVWQSASYVEGDPNSQKRFTRLKIGYDLRGASTPIARAFADTKLNTADASYVTVSTAIPGTSTKTGLIGFQILPLLTKGPALEVKITLANQCDSFEILEINLGVQAPRPDRSN